MPRLLLLLLGSAAGMALWLVLPRPVIEMPHLAVTEAVAYVDGQPEARSVPLGHEPWLCLVLVVDGYRVLRTRDRVICGTWFPGLPVVSDRIQAVADAYCGTVDVALPRGERVRAANPCDTLVYHHPQKGQSA